MKRNLFSAQNHTLAYKVGIISSYSNRILCWLLFC